MKLSDYIDLNPSMSLTKGAMVPFVPMDTVTPGRRWVSASQYRAAAGSGSKFAPGDTLFARITPCLENGKIAQYRGDAPSMGSTEFFVLRARKGISDPGFVYYFSQTEPLRSAAEKSMSGATGRQRADLEVLRDYECVFPHLHRQERISEILSAYDQLIENSEQRTRVLEQTARTIHREWFVNFRFPGNEKIPRVRSPLGDIPDNFVVKRIPDCIHINPKTAVSRAGKKPFVPMGCLSTDSMLISNIEMREGNSGAKFKNGDTLFARITPCLENGKTGFVQFLPYAESVACGSTEFIVLRSRSLTPEFVYCLARSEEFRSTAIKSMSGATGRQRVQEECFNNFLVAQPPPDLMINFSRLVVPIFRLIQQLHLQVEHLSRSRNLLLHSLMSEAFSHTTR